MSVSRVTFLLFVIAVEVQVLIVGRGECCSFAGMSGWGSGGGSRGGVLCALIYFTFERLEASC